MPLVPAKCPDCGASVQVDNAKKAGICEFCKNPFVIEDAINNYNYYVTQNIQTDNVNVYSGAVSMEELLQREPIYIRTKQDGQLEQLYNQMIEHYPQRYEGWWGMIQLRSHQFTTLSASTLELCDNYWEQVKKSAPPSILVGLAKTYEDYHNRAILSGLNEQERELQSQITGLQNGIKFSSELYQRKLEDCKRETRQNNKKIFAALFRLIIGAAVSIFLFDFFMNAAPLIVVLFGVLGLVILFVTLRSFLRALKESSSGNTSVGDITEQQNAEQSDYESKLQEKKAQLAQVQQKIKTLKSQIK